MDTLREEVQYRCTPEELEAFRRGLKALRSPDGMFPFLREMGGRLDWVRGNQARGSIRVTEKNRNPFKILHGGALFTLADTIGGYPALQPGIFCLTKNGEIHFLHPVVGGEAVCTATIRRLSFRSATVQVEIADGNGGLAAIGTFEYVLVSTEKLEE